MPVKSYGSCGRSEKGSRQPNLPSVMRVRSLLQNGSDIDEEEGQKPDHRSSTRAKFGHRKRRGSDGLSDSLDSRKSPLESIKIDSSQGRLSPRDLFEAKHKPIHQIARDGDVELLRKLSSVASPEAMRKRVNSLDAQLLAPLHYAARYHNLPMAKELIAHGANVNHQGVDNLTPLHFAAKYRRMPKAARSSRMFYRNQSIPDAPAAAFADGVLDAPEAADRRQDFADSPAVDAASREVAASRRAHGDDTSSLSVTPAEEENIIAYLLSEGANINARDKYGLTPLHYAAMRGSRTGTPYLLRDPNVDIEAEDEQKIRPLHMACTYGETEVVRMLLEKGADVRAADEAEETSLHKAAMVGNPGVIRMLLEAGAAKHGADYVRQMVADRDSDESTPLHHAVDGGLPEICELLLEAGADANALRFNGTSPLHLAAKSGDVSICRMLVKAGARLNAVNFAYQTPLHRAAAFDQADCIHFLIDCGADVDMTDKNGLTPLLLAASSGQPHAVAALIHKGASISVMDSDEKTAVYWAAENGNTASLSELLNHPLGLALIGRSDRNDNSPLHAASAKGCVGVVKLLLDKEAQIDDKNDEEATPLHLAAKFGRLGVVRELIRRDHNVVTDEDENDDTALHIASCEGHFKVVRCLLEAGADVEARNGKLWTPVDCAAYYGHLKCVQLLIDADSPIDSSQIKARTTPLHLAAEKGHTRPAIAILEHEDEHASSQFCPLFEPYWLSPEHLKWRLPHAYALIVEELLAAGASVSIRDASGMNALELSIINNHRQVAEAIIDSDQWKEALSDVRTSSKTGARITPFRMLIKRLPEVAEKVLSKCVESNGRSPDDRNFSVTFIYEFIDDSYAMPGCYELSEGTEINENGPGVLDESSASRVPQRQQEEKGTMMDCVTSGSSSVYGKNNHLLPEARPYARSSHEMKKNHPLTLMCKHKRTRLLGHPLTKALLRSKWKQFGRYLYYFNLIFYCIFVALLTAYVLDSPGPKPLEPLKIEPSFPLPNATNFRFDCDKMAALEHVGEQNPVARTVKIAIFFMAAINVLKEIFQMSQAGFWRYLMVENVLEWICYLTALALVVDFTECSARTGIREPWQWAVGAISVFMAWINLLLFIKRFPFFGLYVIMVTNIFATFSRFFIVFFLFIIAFALGFYMLLQQEVNAGFGSLGESIVKTFVMMVGEFEYAAIFYENKSKLYYPWLTYVFFTVFVVVMSLIIMNLLVGLAVDDIKGAQEQAVLNKLAMQVSLVLDVEEALPEFFRRRTVLRQETIVPSHLGRLGFFGRLLADQASLTGILASLEDHEDEDHRQVEFHAQQELLYEKLLDTRRKVKGVQEEVSRMRSIMEAVAEKLEVDWEEDGDEVDDG